MPVAFWFGYQRSDRFETSPPLMVPKARQTDKGMLLEIVWDAMLAVQWIPTCAGMTLNFHRNQNLAPVRHPTGLLFEYLILEKPNQCRAIIQRRHRYMPGPNITAGVPASNLRLPILIFEIRPGARRWSV